MTDHAQLESVIEAAWEDRADISASTHGEVRKAVEQAVGMLDAGEARVASRGADGVWTTHQWLKKAVLLSFRLNDNTLVRGGDRGAASHAPGVGPWWDKVPNKFGDWTASHYQDAGFRSVPGAIVRQGAYIARNVVLMPSFVNIGAFVDEGSMVDAWATVGSCAQIGKNVHLSGGAGIGGVLAMGVYLSGSTKIVDRATGEVFRGEVPAYSVVVPGSLPDPNGGPSLYCAVIVKRVDAQTRAKTGVNELLRD